MESERASYWPEYWQAKKDAISKLKAENRMGILESGISFYLYWAVPLSKEMEILGLPKGTRGFGFPGDGIEGCTPQELLHALVRGVLLYDNLVWDATYFEKNLFHMETNKRYHRARKKAVDTVIELMRDGFLYPYNFWEDTTVEEEIAEDILCAYLADDAELQRIVASWELDDVHDAYDILLAYVRTLDFSRKLNSSIISTRQDKELYEQILLHFSSVVRDKKTQNIMENLISTNVPYFYVNSLEPLRGFAKERCVKDFREKVWRVVKIRTDNSDQTIVELMTELDRSRKELAELAKTLSLAKLVWGIVTIAITPLLPSYPFPYSLVAPTSSLVSREALAKIAEYYGTKKHRWIFAIDELHKFSKAQLC